jgi:hypothetical protein
MASAALALGIVSGAAEISQYIQATLGPEAWTIMRRWHGEVIADGLAVAEPASGLILGVLDRAKGALRGRGRQEASLLDPLYRRLDRRENPAQRARTLLATDGLAAVIDAASIPVPVE